MSVNARTASIAGIMTALVSISTMVFTVYIPATRGFFNTGEVMVYTTALLFGPYIGAFAGGVGSMFADILLGYYYYAPGTLIIKACEGAIVGVLAKNTPKIKRQGWKLFATLIGITPGVLLWLIGSIYYRGTAEVTIGYQTLSVFIPVEAWYVIGASVTLLTISAMLRIDPRLRWTIFPIMIGGPVMVTGYFLYQQFVGPYFFPEEFVGVYALGEIPFNVAQMIVGLIVAIPIVKAIRKHLPALGETYEASIRKNA